MCSMALEEGVPLQQCCHFHPQVPSRFPTTGLVVVAGNLNLGSYYYYRPIEGEAAALGIAVLQDLLLLLCPNRSASSFSCRVLGCCDEEEECQSVAPPGPGGDPQEEEERFFSFSSQPGSNCCSPLIPAKIPARSQLFLPVPGSKL